MGGVRVGLALGGGAARGLAHVGFIKVLEREGISVHAIAGTSMGAIVGSKYALNPNARVLEEDLFRFLESDVFKEAHLDFLKEGDEQERGFFFHLAQYISKKVYYTLAATQRSLIKEETFRGIMESLIPDVPLEFTRIPFAATAVDLRSGVEVVLQGGSLRDAVAASCALPGILPPVGVDGYELVDGGWLDLVPGSVARRLGAHVVVGVWVGSDLGEACCWDSSIDILSRADEITRHYLGVFRLQECDVVVAPSVGHYSWADFDRAQEVIDAGEEAALKALPSIRNAIRKARFKRWFPFSRSSSRSRIPFSVYP